MSTSNRGVVSVVVWVYRLVARMAAAIRDDDGPVVPAVTATAFPLVVYTTGVPEHCLIPLFAIAFGAWVDAFRTRGRRGH